MRLLCNGEYQTFWSLKSNSVFPVYPYERAYFEKGTSQTITYWHSLILLFSQQRILLTCVKILFMLEVIYDWANLANENSAACI